MMVKPVLFRLTRMTGLFLILLLLIASGCGPADNPTPVNTGKWYVSPSGNDTNDCLSTAKACRTINAAITKAADGADETVFIAAGTYHEQVLVPKSIFITGTGSQASDVVIDGSQQFQVLSAGCWSCSKSIQISNLVIQNGLAPKNGGFSGAGGLTVIGAKLTMSNVIIRENQSALGEYGVGGGVFIQSNSTLTISDSTITQNTNSNAATTKVGLNLGSGGGIYNAGTLNITGGVTISENIANDDGGGIYNTGQLVMNGGSIENNQAPGYNDGGGLWTNGTTTLTGVTIDGNAAGALGGGIYQTYGSVTTRLTATGISLVNNQASQGGGVYNSFTDAPGVQASLNYLKIVQSTIAYNHATYNGGGIFNTDFANMYLVNDTLSNNEVFAMGGGIASGNTGSGLLLNVTIAYNKAPNGGGGIAVSGGYLELQNVLLANNTFQNCSFMNGSSLAEEAGNLADDASCNLTAPLDQSNVQAKIGTLSSNGGTTQTIALNAGSPAIDGGLQFLAPLNDQRGFARGVDGNGDGVTGFDIGATEVVTVVDSLQITVEPVTATPAPDIFTLNQAADCRSGPGTDYQSLVGLAVGAAPGAVARSDDNSWIELYQPGQYLCWAPGSAGSLNGDLADLLVGNRPPLLIPSITPTPVSLVFTPRINANCRSGPDPVFGVQGFAMSGQPYQMDGRNQNNTWYRIMLTPTRGCWVIASAGAASRDTLPLRILRSPSTPTPTNVPNCSSYTDADHCSQNGCEWIPADLTHGPYCGP